MLTMKKSIWQRATEEHLLKAASRALRRNRPLKTYSPKDLQWYLDHGWRILSHTQPSYGQGQYWLLVQD